MDRMAGYLGHGIGLAIASLYTVAGQAHFTNRFTPDLFRHIDFMTHNSHAAFSFVGMEFGQLKAVFGAFDLVAAFLLWRKSSRRTGLMMAIIGFTGGTYGQLYGGDDVTQVATFLALSFLGWYFLGISGDARN